MAPIDDGLLTAAKQAVSRRVDAEAALAHSRVDEQLALRRLQLAGASVREIAAALGISHQRVQQMIDAIDDGRGWKRKGRTPHGDLLRCSFCDAAQSEVSKLIAGPGCYICAPCVAIARHRFDRFHLCSFCGKTLEQVTEIVGDVDSNIGICFECLDLCDEIISEELGGTEGPGADPVPV